MAGPLPKICFHEIENERTDVTDVGAEKNVLPNIATFSFQPIVRIPFSI